MLAILLLAGLTSPASAAQINYGSFTGNAVTYINVTEDSATVPLFGAPTVTGNSLDFNPVGFDAFSGGAGSELTVANLAFQVAAKPGNYIPSITLSEAGDTTLAGNVAPGSMGTSSAVFVSGVLDILEVDFAGINAISVPFSMTFSPSGGTYFLGTDGGGGPIFHTQWAGSVTLPIEAILDANGLTYVDGATRVALDLNNVLAAVSETGTSATIAKKDFGGLTVAVRGTIVPEPATLALAASGIALLAVSRPRRARRARR